MQKAKNEVHVAQFIIEYQDINNNTDMNGETLITNLLLKNKISKWHFKFKMQQKAKKPRVFKMQQKTNKPRALEINNSKKKNQKDKIRISKTTTLLQSNTIRRK